MNNNILFNSLSLKKTNPINSNKQQQKNGKKRSPKYIKEMYPKQNELKNNKKCKFRNKILKQSFPIFNHPF